MGASTWAPLVLLACALVLVQRAPDHRAPALVRRAPAAPPALVRHRALADPAPARKRLAFMFLTRGEMRHEPMWNAYFGGKAESAVHAIFVHPARGFRGYNKTSVFYGRELEEKLRVDATWGGPGLIQSVRHMLRVALDDQGRNTHFALLSETCIPLWSLPITVSMLDTAMVTSIAEGFRNASMPTGYGGFWVQQVFLQSPTSQHGVKSTEYDATSQWFVLHRAYALIVSFESELWDDMQVYCEIGYLCSDYGADMQREHLFLEREMAKMKEWADEDHPPPADAPPTGETEFVPLTDAKIEVVARMGFKVGRLEARAVTKSCHSLVAQPAASIEEACEVLSRANASDCNLIRHHIKECTWLPRCCCCCCCYARALLLRRLLMRLLLLLLTCLLRHGAPRRPPQRRGRAQIVGSRPQVALEPFGRSLRWPATQAPPRWPGHRRAGQGTRQSGQGQGVVAAYHG